jgi:hypothetical protein
VASKAELCEIYIQEKFIVCKPHTIQLLLPCLEKFVVNNIIHIAKTLMECVQKLPPQLHQGNTLFSLPILCNLESAVARSFALSSCISIWTSDPNTHVGGSHDFYKSIPCTKFKKNIKKKHVSYSEQLIFHSINPTYLYWKNAMSIIRGSIIIT